MRNFLMIDVLVYVHLSEKVKLALVNVIKATFIDKLCILQTFAVTK